MCLEMFCQHHCKSVCSYDSQRTVYHMMNWSNSISMKWSWKQKRWSQDHECANLIKILLFLPLILRVVKNLLLLLWLLEAKCDLLLYSIFLSPPALGHPKYEEPPESVGFNRLRGQLPLGHCDKCLKKQPRLTPDRCNNGLVLLHVFLSTINLPSPFPEKPFLALFCSTNPLLLLHPSLPFTWRSYSSFSKAHQAQCFSPV